MPSRPPSPPTAVLVVLAVIAILAGCERGGHRAAYRLSDRADYTLRYEAVLKGRAEGSRGSRPYDARAHARLGFKAVPDSAGGRIEIAFTADSIAFAASDRDGGEGRYMEERLRRYKARMVLTTSGKVLAVEEEPEPPPVDFSPLNIGRFLAYGLPAFPAIAVRAGSEWRVEQPLLDKFHPGSRLVKRYKAQGIRETGEGRLLSCAVEVEAWLEEDLSQGQGSAAAPRPSLSGRGEAVFNLDRGMPVSSTLELEGRFNSQVREGGSDSSRVVDLPVRLDLKLDLRFGD